MAFDEQETGRRVEQISHLNAASSDLEAAFMDQSDGQGNKFNLGTSRHCGTLDFAIEGSRHTAFVWGDIENAGGSDEEVL